MASHFHTFTFILSHIHSFTFTLSLSHFHSPEHQVWHVSSSFGWTGWPRSVGLFLRGEHFYLDSRYSTLLGHFILFGTHHLLMFWTETHDIILQVSQEDNPYLENIIDICSNITQVGWGFDAAKISMYYLSMHWYVIHCNVLHIKYLHITY